MRASETHEQALRRQEQDRICTASMINPRRACAGGLRLCVCVSVRNLNLGAGASRGLNEGTSEQSGTFYPKLK